MEKSHLTHTTEKRDLIPENESKLDSTPAAVSENSTGEHVHGLRLVLVVLAMILALFLIFLDEVSPLL
jgi:hypothetical protein